MNKLLCPCCAGEQHCPCSRCYKEHGQKVTWAWKGPNGPISCGHCGFTMTLDDWLDFEWEFFKDWEDEDNLD